MASSTQYSSNDTAQWGTHWHLRINQPSEAFITSLLVKIKDLVEQNYLTYSVAAKETTTNIHLHGALGTYRSVNKFSLAAKLGLRKNDGNFHQYYLAPIYKESSPINNANYVRKDGDILIDVGEIPDTTVERSATEASKGQKREKWVNMIKLAKAQEWELLEEQYPYEFINQGAKLKSLYFIQHTPKDRSHNQHLWIYGPPGTGKSAIVEVLFPNHYKKRPDPDWLGYNPTLQSGHSVVYLGDFDIQSMATLKPENLKLMCDPQGFNANKKFGGGEIVAPGRVVVTSNFRLGNCFKPGIVGIEQQKAALRRRFREVHIDTLLRELGLKLKPKEELEKLKAENNFDFSKCFVKVEPEVIDLTNEIEEKAQEVIDLTTEEDLDFEEANERIRKESKDYNILTPRKKPPTLYKDRTMNRPGKRSRIIGEDLGAFHEFNQLNPQTTTRAQARRIQKTIEESDLFNSD